MAKHLLSLEKDSVMEFRAYKCEFNLQTNLIKETLIYSLYICPDLTKCGLRNPGLKVVGSQPSSQWCQQKLSGGGGEGGGLHQAPVGQVAQTLV